MVANLPQNRSRFVAFGPDEPKQPAVAIEDGRWGGMLRTMDTNTAEPVAEELRRAERSDLLVVRGEIKNSFGLLRVHNSQRLLLKENIMILYKMIRGEVLSIADDTPMPATAVAATIVSSEVLGPYKHKRLNIICIISID